MLRRSEEKNANAASSLKVMGRINSLTTEELEEKFSSSFLTAVNWSFAIFEETRICRRVMYHILNIVRVWLLESINLLLSGWNTYGKSRTSRWSFSFERILERFRGWGRFDDLGCKYIANYGPQLSRWRWSIWKCYSFYETSATFLTFVLNDIKTFGARTPNIEDC